ncbi:Transmembrane protein [Rhodotorula toruloides ATCC 204091]|uniref:Transmembrane protein n=1 Tax=Rhodotorula toruloides TaxID=5286 RepID=A0A0K3CP45_RHOTO|nr:Transmembrane protein [Rhodotorula toruloides ATCC 204091]KAK4331414.1 Transmembrane protein [Rhodotorula toruloides]PRQ70002.1 transmembrane protein [Rhodotorula toruloides]
MSNFIPSTFTRPPAQQADSSGSPTSPLPSSLYTDCQTCRITGTLTLAGVGLYAMTVSRRMAKTQVGKGAASLMGLGFLTAAAVRWTAYTPPPVVDDTPGPV